MIFERQSLPFFESESIFKKYITDFSALSPFFQFGVKDWQACLQQRAGHSFPRERVAEILTRQNARWNCGRECLDNISAIKNRNTFLIITGQQAGIYGGPLYTIYKAISAIKVARELNDRYPGYQFLPLFWMEVGDNDYAEVNHLNILDIKNERHELSLPADADDKRSVSLRKLPAEIANISASLSELLSDSEFKLPELQTLARFYKAGNSFADAFAAWLHHYLGKFGLIVFDPTDADFKELALPYFQKSLENSGEINTLLRKNAESLSAAGFTPPVNIRDNQTLLFTEDAHRARCRVDEADGGFDLNVSGAEEAEFYSAEAMLELAATRPENFSPNVLLRPILQDAILPSAAYIGGPGEISYLSQLKSLYRFFGVPQPIFLPRTRLTIIERKVDRWVRKFGLNYPKIYERRENIIPDYIAGHSENRLTALFSEIEQQFSHVFKSLHVELKEVDPQLQPAIDKTEAQCVKAMQNLKQRSEKALERKMEGEVLQMKNMLKNLFPAGNFQEREVNLVYFTAKYGPEFIDALFEAFPVFDDHHHLLFM